MFKRVLVAIDGSPTSTCGLQAAMALAADQRAELFIMHVLHDQAVPPNIYDGTFLPGPYVEMQRATGREAARRIIREACALADAQGMTANPVLIESRVSDVCHEILREARKLRADVIVLGTHGRRGLRRVVMGSDAEAVVRESKVPVLLVREGWQPRREASKPVRRAAQASALLNGAARA
jgi:nucleotide-binding universal stress UspA family protein